MIPVQTAKGIVWDIKTQTTTDEQGFYKVNIGIGTYKVVVDFMGGYDEKLVHVSSYRCAVADLELGTIAITQAIQTNAL